MNIFQTYFRRKTYAFPLVLLILVILVSFGLQLNLIGPEKFFANFPRLLNGNLRSFMPLIFLAVAQAVVLMNGSIDLSIGNLMSVVAAFLVTNLTVEASLDRFLLVFLMAVGLGMVAGALNGICVALIRLPPFITTYATSYIFSGVALWLLPRPGGQMPDLVAEFYRRYLPLGLPIGIWIILVLLGLWVLVRDTRFGEYLYAIGGSDKASFASGVHVVRHRLAVHILAGIIAAFAALFLTLSTGSSDARIGSSMTMDSVVAVVLGGTPMAGGVGGIAGPVFGVMILGFTRNIVAFANVNTWFQPLVDALIILVALASPSAIKLIKQQVK